MAIKIAYLDYSHIFAGAERVLYTIINNLDRNEFEPILVFPYPMTHQKGYEDLKCKKVYLSKKIEWWMGSDRWHHPLRGTDFLMRTIMGCKLASLLLKEKINILHVNLIRPDSLMWIMPSQKIGVKVIGHFRSQALEWIPPKSVQHNCDLILCVSKYSQSRLLSKGQYTRTQVLYDSINLNLFQSELSRSDAKKKLGFSEESFLISSIGQLSRHKGHDNAIKAFLKIAPYQTNTILFIAGGGRTEDLEYLKQIVKEHPSIQTRVIFSEKQVSNIVDVYRASDLVLSLTKVGEAFGLVPYEAAIMGTPFIAPNKGAVKEFIIHRENGLLVETNNIDEIATQIEWAINHKKECEHMNMKAKEVIQSKLTPYIMTNQLQSVYKELIY